MSVNLFLSVAYVDHYSVLGLIFFTNMGLVPVCAPHFEPFGASSIKIWQVFHGKERGPLCIVHCLPLMTLIIIILLKTDGKAGWLVR